MSIPHETAAGILKHYWHYDRFREPQEQIIESIHKGNDTIALLPTGGGKSVCFQVPALLSEGTCIVVSPLIALMKDQVEQLKLRGIPALALHSGLSRREQDFELDHCLQGRYRFLYVSPERLQSRHFCLRLAQLKINLVAIDEAHCISQWGYDFRPAYLAIKDFREQTPGVTYAAFTASATSRVLDDIGEKLGMIKPVVFRKSFARPNLAYIVQKEEDKFGRLLKIIRSIGGSGLVYVRSRKMTRDIAETLLQSGIKASYYHAGLKVQQRDQRQQEWIENKVQVMVCTNAFGMGIDKPDVRFVVHFGLTDNPENYFQEAGRGGRDGKKSYAVLLYSPFDIDELERHTEASFPPESQVRRVYQALVSYYQLAVGVNPDRSYDFDIDAFCKTFKLHPLQTHYCLHFLEKEGFLVLNEAYHIPSRIRILADRLVLYDLQVKNKDVDDFIKLLLRSRAGLFDDFVPVNEDGLARLWGKKRDKVDSVIRFLVNNGTIEYLPQKTQAQIVFITSVPRAEHIELSAENYRLQKKLAFERMEAMKHYATSNQTCRSVILLSYFNEKNASDCGVCDVCIEKRKLTIKDKKVKSVEFKIVQIIESNPGITLSALAQQMENEKKDVWIALLNQLTDNGDVLFQNERWYPRFTSN